MRGLRVRNDTAPTRFRRFALWLARHMDKAARLLTAWAQRG